MTEWSKLLRREQKLFPLQEEATTVVEMLRAGVPAMTPPLSVMLNAIKAFIIPHSCVWFTDLGGPSDLGWAPSRDYR